MASCGATRSTRASRPKSTPCTIENSHEAFRRENASLGMARRHRRANTGPRACQRDRHGNFSRPRKFAAAIPALATETAACIFRVLANKAFPPAPTFVNFIVPPSHSRKKSAWLAASIPRGIHARSTPSTPRRLSPSPPSTASALRRFRVGPGVRHHHR